MPTDYTGSEEDDFLQMTLLDALLLGLIQGLTEFLPVSSSGHLRLFGATLGLDSAQTLFDVCVHGGTLGAVLAFYRKEVQRMLRGLTTPRWSNPGFRLAMLVLIGTIPAATVGLSIGNLLEAHLTGVAVVGGLLLVNGLILMKSRSASTTGRSLDELTVRDALWIGTAQAAAILRGISRSGTTIVTGLHLGIDRQAAASFSFLLSIPAIGGALLLELGKGWTDGGLPGDLLLAGASAAALSGYAALALVVAVVRKGRLHHFAWYCWAVGIVALIVGLTGPL
jgi:undecaprenyl-diphosphatase